MLRKRKSFQNPIGKNHLFLLGLFFCSAVSSSQALEFTIEPSDVLVPEGSSVLLQCAGKLDVKSSKDVKATPSIRWRGPDGQDLGIVGDTFRAQLANGSLYISSVEENRGLTGGYQCLLSWEGVGTIVSRSARVSIADLPDVNQDSSEIYLSAGQTAYFKCVSTPISSAVAQRYTFRWQKDDAPLRFDETRMTYLPSGALEIDELLHSDRGTYQCNVSTGTFSRLSSKLNLNIKAASGIPEQFLAPTFQTIPLPQTVKEGDMVTLDCVANGNPKPAIKWLKNGQEIDMSDLDSRFRLAGTSSLQITHAQDNDTGDYQCRASNTLDSLDASATIQVQIPPKFTERPIDKIAYEKEELELSCSIHGKPTPIIQWLKNGDVIKQNDYMQIVGGHNLRILGLINSDAGMFQCIGTNPAGSVQASARLQIVESDPTRRNRNQSKKMLTQLQLSKLKPHQRGYERFDKKNLGASSDSRLLSKTALDSLLSKDKRKFQDSGKFKHDQYLDTEDDYSEAEPEDDDEDDEEEDEGPEEVGSIHPFGPNVDAGKLLHSLIHSRGPDKDQATGDNDENDADVMHFSNSPYPAVTRKYPHLDGAGAQPVILPGQPRDLQAQIVKSRFITLSWLEPAKYPEEVTSYSVFYKSVTSDRERKITTKSRDDQEVNIQALMPGKEYQFRVVANSASGPGESSEILEISTQPEENISGPPQNVDGEAVSASEIHVKWDPPVVTNGIISKYRVYYSEGENGHEMYADSTDTSINLTELRPYREYTISVASWNQNGMGVSSGEVLVKTHSAAPSGQPNNVTLETTSSTSIAIRWEPPDEEDRNGQITGYKIRYRIGKKNWQVDTTPGNVRYYELKNLERMAAYQVKLAAMTMNGVGPFTDSHHIETYENDLDESQVPSAPAWIKTRPSADKVSVSWGAPIQQEIKVRGYVIGWGLGVPDEFVQSLDENNRFYEIVGLTPNSEYVISLRARNSVGDGQPVYDTVRTREEIPVEMPAPLEVPVGLRAIPMSGTSIVVYWTDTTLSKSQHVTDNRQYIVRYSSTGSTRFRYHNTTDLNCMIGDLRPNTQYEFAVKVVKGRRESSWSMSVLNTTNHPTPGSPPRDLSVRLDDRNPQNAILTWQTPKQSPGITGYVVFYTIDTSKRDRDWSVEAVLGDTTTAVIKNLKPMTTYYFKVQSRNAKGQIGPFSTMVAHTTGADSGVRESMGTGQLPPPIVYTIIGITAFTLIIAIIVVFRVCRRKSNGTPEHSKKSYQKNNAGIIKPPDLWIHHDQMELKNLGKNSQPPPPVPTPGYSDCASSSGGGGGVVGVGVGSVAGIGGSEVGLGGGRDTMTLPRSSHDYETESSMSHVTNSLDKRNYVPGYMTNPMNSSMERPYHARQQYNNHRPPHMLPNMDQGMSQQSLLQQQQPSAMMPGPEIPYTYEALPSNYSNPNVTYAPGLSVDAPKRGQGHPLKSFSVPVPPPTSTPTISGQKHNVPAVTIRPQNSSPYKKPPQPGATNIPANRLQTGPVVPHSSDEIQRLKPSTSTEELNQEMANLEGLMKDLSAITANEFEC